MTFYQILSLCGFSTIFLSIMGALMQKLKKNTEDTTAIKLGIQALLRGQLINEWNKRSKEGYAPIYSRDNFENMWKQYHSLGANGVMDDIREKFMNLPTEKGDESNGRK